MRAVIAFYATPDFVSHPRGNQNLWLPNMIAEMAEWIRLYNEMVALATQSDNTAAGANFVHVTDGLTYTVGTLGLRDKIKQVCRDFKHEMQQRSYSIQQVRDMLLMLTCFKHSNSLAI